MSLTKTPATALHKQNSSIKSTVEFQAVSGFERIRKTSKSSTIKAEIASAWFIGLSKISFIQYPV
jgi:O-phosphoseryl-tRNA(Cys) synthetase